jgi:hypothetical protein
MVVQGSRGKGAAILRELVRSKELFSEKEQRRRKRRQRQRRRKRRQ